VAFAALYHTPFVVEEIGTPRRVYALPILDLRDLLGHSFPFTSNRLKYVDAIVKMNNQIAMVLADLADWIPLWKAELLTILRHYPINVIHYEDSRPSAELLTARY
jgi:hypothetical protein